MILNEKMFKTNVLNEKMSDSMPKWLQSRLLYTKRDRTPNRNQKEKYKKMGFDMDSQSSPTYASRGDWTPLFDLFLTKGIDIDNAEFIDDGDIPTSSRDPRLKEPYIPIFFLQGQDPYGKNFSQVYAKGLNDDEIAEFDSEYRKLKFISMKTLLQYTKGFCYLDSSNANNFNVGKKQGVRQEYKRDEKNSGRKRYKPEEQSRWEKYDKSGYLIDPEKMANKLSEYYKKNSSVLLEKMYKKLSNLKNDFAQVYLDTDLNNLDSEEYNLVFGDAYSGLNKKLINAVASYNRFAKDINDALNIQDEEDRNYQLDRIFDYRYRELNNYVNSLEKSAERVMSVALDWD